jgi:hypothetical protein
VVGGTITAARTSKVRLEADLTLVHAANTLLDIDNQHCQARIYRGMPSLGTAERIQLGVFRVDDVDRSAFGEVHLNCSGMEAYVLDARFLQPRTPLYGISAMEQIKTLIKEVMPTAKIRVLATVDAPLRTRVPWERERWDAIEALGTFLNVETYSDHSGDFLIADMPDLINPVPVYAVDEGDGGVLVTRQETDTRDQIYNAVSASGTSSDSSVPPVWGWAYDDNPTSPTYYYADPQGPGGGFGQVPRFYVSGFFTDSGQCTRTAQKMLADALAENVKLSFTTLPLGMLEVGDTVSVTMRDGSVSNHLINKLTLDLGIDGTMQVETMSTKVEARETEESSPEDTGA